VVRRGIVVGTTLLVMAMAACTSSAKRLTVTGVPAPVLTQPPTTVSVADAKVAIAAAFSIALQGSGHTQAEITGAIEDGAALWDLIQQAAASHAGTAYQAGARINSIAFPAGRSDLAEVNFTILLNGQPIVSGIAGTAVLQGEHWKVSLATDCGILQLGGTPLTGACAGQHALVIGQPPLPEPGPQPVDPAAALTAVTDAFTVVYGHGAPSARFAYLQGADPQVAAASQQAAANNSTIAANSVPVVREVVFVDPSNAAVLYEIDYQGRAVVGPKTGYAVLDGGTWKVTRATYCADVNNGGAHC
jgi:hypothetical protein